MDKNSAARLIQEVFQNSFNRDRFVTFTKNLFNFLDTEKNFVYRGNFIPDAYKPYINTLERIGKYEDAEENKIDVLIVHLKKEHSIEYARTMQRNFIAWYLGGSRGGELKDAALVAFYTDNPDDWRFSLVKMDYQIVESSTGKIKTKTELTPARRFSFLVGKNENSHTAQRQLLPTLQDDKNNPLLSDLEKAFNIEVVTQEFFEKYKSLFLDVKDSLERLMKKDPTIAKDFAEKGVDPVDFSKKLLGQIVFLYFLQKKGWFGVERDSNWGTGPKNFLRLLFEKMLADYKNFFNDILEPLFYEALAKERDDDFYSRFNCKIPFLNGGLFDPLSDYDWVHTDILLPDELFSNQIKTKEGDTGTGILDIFDRYNFTVKEDEPLEKEVAVDPEMLGKVFENLLEVKDRKSKGTYYTPREIVHYMCQESLINYLVNECEGKVGRKDIDTLIQYGETAVEHDSRVEQEGKETETYSYKLPESIRKNAQLVDDKLKNIRVCDPAIGSGAFPVGMMNEIIRTRNTLTNYLENKTDRSIYNFKRDAIQNSLYGVDIDPGAVEIAKLRLWLSLVVDEQDIKQIKPLPNLDYKIMQGNSLLEEFEGVRLFDEELISRPSLDDDEQIAALKQRQNELQREFISLYSKGQLKGGKKQELEIELKKILDSLKKLSRPVKPKSENGNLFDVFSEAKKKAQELKQLHKEFFEASQKTKKDELKRRIEKLEWELIETTLKEQNKMSALNQLEQYRQTNIKPFFLWRLNFAEVFAEKGGFDIVIANPPYLRVQELPINDKVIYRKLYNSAVGAYDLYILFFEKGFSLLNEQGILNYITPDKWINGNLGKGLRRLVANYIIKLISFKHYQIFNASTYSSLVWIKKTIQQQTLYFELDQDLPNNKDLQNWLVNIDSSKFSLINNNILGENAWIFTNKLTIGIMQKLAELPRKVSNVFENIFQGIATSKDSVYFIYNCKEEDGYIAGFSEALNKKVLLEMDFVKPLLMGNSVHRYRKLKTKNMVIFPYSINNLEGSEKANSMPPSYIEEHFPKVWQYFLNCENLIKGREKGKLKNAKDWYRYIYPKNLTLFNKPKLVCPYISVKSQFSLDENGEFYTNTKVYGFIKKDKQDDYRYLLALLNSTLTWFYIKNVSAVFRGGYYTYSPMYINNFPIPPLLLEQQKPFIVIVDNILAITGASDYLSNNEKQARVKDYEKQIDQLVYKLYGLTPEEIAIVEGKNGKEI